MGVCFMSDDVQVDSNQPTTVSDPPPEAGAAKPGFKVVPYEDRIGEKELYSFRDAIKEPEPSEESTPKKAKRKRMPLLLLGGLAVVVLAASFLYHPSAKPSKPPALYMDLGARQVDSAGLSGRLIVRWEGSAGYQLHVDPIDQGQTAEFQAVAQDPPYPLSVNLRLHDASGVVVCQKEINLPAIAQLDGGADNAALLAPRQTANGDTVENMAGPDGQIAEITASGSLPCSQQAYQSLAGWDFSTNFPGASDQQDWLRHESSLPAGSRPTSRNRRSAQPQTQRLPMAIEGDDVIVGDNATKGTVTTGGGRVFWLGAAGMHNRAPEWQVFPAAIHFRCDKNGQCVLTRSNSRNTLQARLTR